MTERSPVPDAVLQAIGLICLLVAVAVLYDGWHVVGALGIVLVFGRHEAVALLNDVGRSRRSGCDKD